MIPGIGTQIRIVHFERGLIRESPSFVKNLRQVLRGIMTAKIADTLSGGPKNMTSWEKSKEHSAPKSVLGT